MPEKMNQSPAEMLNQNAAVAQNAEVPAPAAPVTPARQSYAEKVQGLTIDERLADGYYYSKSVRLLQYLLEHPWELEKPMKEEVQYE